MYNTYELIWFDSSEKWYLQNFQVDTNERAENI